MHELTSQFLDHETAERWSDAKPILLPSPQEAEFLISYNKLCENASDNSSEVFIPNFNEFRSQITSSHLFRKAENNLKVYTYGFRRNLDDSKAYYFLSNLEKAIINTEKTDIIVDQLFNSNVVKRLFELKADPLIGQKLGIYLVDSEKTVKLELQRILSSIQETEIIPQFRKSDPHYHFTISDYKGYRLEYDSDDKLAKVYFNDPKDALRLTKVFEHIKTNFTTEQN